MNSLRLSFTLAAMMVVAATVFTAATPAAAAPVVARLEITPEEVANAGAWQDLAQAIGLPWNNLFVDNNGKAVGTQAPLPMPLVGQMYGGAWGTRGSALKQVLPDGWRTWAKGANDDGEIPGVLAALPADTSGVVVHAQRGAGGEVFLFVGTQSGATGQEAVSLATQLQAAINGQNAALWSVFCDAVSQTPTGTSAARAEKAIVTLAATQGFEVDAEGNLTKSGEVVRVAAPAVGPKTDPFGRSTTGSLLLLIAAVVAAFVITLLWIRKKRRGAAATSRANQPQPTQSEPNVIPHGATSATADTGDATGGAATPPITPLPQTEIIVHGTTGPAAARDTTDQAAPPTVTFLPEPTITVQSGPTVTVLTAEATEAATEGDDMVEGGEPEPETPPAPPPTDT